MATVPPPILLTVDDDPEVSRSLARDLRQQYGEDYRIRRAESGPEALDALRSSSSVTNRSACCWPTTACRR